MARGPVARRRRRTARFTPRRWLPFVALTALVVGAVVVGAVVVVAWATPTMIVTVEPLATSLPAVGACEITRPTLESPAGSGRVSASTRNPAAVSAVSFL